MCCRECTTLFTLYIKGLIVKKDQIVVITRQKERKIMFQAHDWIMLPPGDKALCRRPVREGRDETTRLATLTEVLVANRGYMFPWGNYPDTSRAHVLWQGHGVGAGGLIHDAWFVTEEGKRVGGAPNVPTTGSAALRHCMYLDGGKSADEGATLAENEGYAVVRTLSGSDADAYRKVQLYAARHVGADGGAVIMSPRDKEGVHHVGFVGRCLTCPNAELISFEALKEALPDIRFELFAEWRNWSVAA